jgi:hypothetical protein
MSDFDLVFLQEPATSGDLVFGEMDAGSSLAQITGSFQPLVASFLALPSRNAEITGSFQPLIASFQITGSTTAVITGAFEPLSVSALIGKIGNAQITGTFEPLAVSLLIAPTVRMTITGSFEPLTAALEAVYSSNTSRPTVGQTGALWQTATQYQDGAGARHQDATSAPDGWAAFWERALAAPEVVAQPMPSTLVPMPVRTVAVFEDGTRLSEITGVSHQDATRDRLGLTGLFQNATPVRTNTQFKHQDGDHQKRASRTTRYQEAKPLDSMRSTRMQSATPFLVGKTTWFQDGVPPPPGITVILPPVIPPPPTCYTPNPNLVFSDRWTGLGDLLFICDNYTPFPPGETVVVPVKRVYIVLNSVSLFRASDDEPVPVFSMSLSLDVDSWTWSFNASLPNVALNLVKPTNSEITELRAFVNGTEFRVLAESVSRSRAFGQTSISVSGRGFNAALDAPYAATQSFGNIQERTAQQLMADVLTVNNIPLDWTINWELEDWIVPAGVFNHQGTYISALNTIAGAAGGFLLPHPSSKSFTVKHRYPVKPWDWATATPDFELPASVVTQEGTEWVDKARYNRVYVAGQSVGVMGRITREGTAGDVLAQLVTDPLITEGVAARQRGIAILSDVGMQAHVTLRLPVLAETGVLRPGHMIDYVDGLVTRRGIVRSTQVVVQGSANVWQSIGVETHDV